MLRRIRDMPAGTIGYEAIGEVEDDDYTVLWPSDYEGEFSIG